MEPMYEDAAAPDEERQPRISFGESNKSAQDVSVGAIEQLVVRQWTGRAKCPLRYIC